MRKIDTNKIRQFVKDWEPAPTMEDACKMLEEAADTIDFLSERLKIRRKWSDRWARIASERHGQVMVLNEEAARLREAINRAIEYDTQLLRVVACILKDAVGYKEVEDVAEDDQ